MRRKPGPKRRRVANPRNSVCGSNSLANLDFQNWWTDRDMGCFYLRVRTKPERWEHDGGQTWHRVFCRLSDSPRLRLKDGELWWLIDSAI